MPGKRLLLFFIAYMLSFSFTIIFSVHTVWRAVYPYTASLSKCQITHPSNDLSSLPEA